MVEPKIIYVMPCLNEIQQSPVGFLEGENREGIIVSDCSTVKSASCSSKDVCNNENQATCNKGGLLEYLPYFDDPTLESSGGGLFDRLGTKVGVSKKKCQKICGDYNLQEFWDKAIDYLNNRICPNEPCSVIMVTHHNRMRKHILPLTSLVSDGKKPGYANCCCIKLTSSGAEIVFEGYPDKKDAYNYLGYGVVTESDITIPKLERLRNNISLYVIRHGNAMHNKPLKIKSSLMDQTANLDSTLTPLGVFQAKKLGEILQKNINNESIRIVCSYLQRTQHTALSVLNGVKPNYLLNNETFDKWLACFNKLSYERVKNNKLYNIVAFEENLNKNGISDEFITEFRDFFNNFQVSKSSMGGGRRRNKKTNKKSKRRNKTKSKRTKRRN